MAIQSVQIDPSATDDQSGDEIISAINGGSASITRDGAVDFDILRVVRTNPATGEYKIKNVQRQSDGLIDVEYDDTPEA
jgi:hypothetical protein